MNPMMEKMLINPNSPKYGTKEYYDLWYGKGKVSSKVSEDTYKLTIPLTSVKT